MKKELSELLIIAGIVVFTVLITLALQSCWNNREGVVVSGIETVIDSIVIYDTIAVYVEREKIIVKKEFISVPVMDKTGDTIEIMDTVNCYSIEENIRNNIIIASLCSRSFSEIKPFDLYGRIEFTPSPDTIKHIFRIDTLTIKRNFFQVPQNYIIGALLLGIGTGVYFSLK